MAAEIASGPAIKTADTDTGQQCRHSRRRRLSGHAAGAVASCHRCLMVPMKRAGTPMEVAELVCFLSFARAGCITGQVISINGGMI